MQGVYRDWTTDGFYRETKEMVEYRKGEGCMGSMLEMSIENILFTEWKQCVIFLIDNLSVRGAYYENCKRSRRAKK